MIYAQNPTLLILYYFCQPNPTTPGICEFYSRVIPWNLIVFTIKKRQPELYAQTVGLQNSYTPCGSFHFRQSYNLLVLYHRYPYMSIFFEIQNPAVSKSYHEKVHFDTAGFIFTSFRGSAASERNFITRQLCLKGLPPFSAVTPLRSIPNGGKDI